MCLWITAINTRFSEAYLVIFSWFCSGLFKFEGMLMVLSICSGRTLGFSIQIVYLSACFSSYHAILAVYGSFQSWSNCSSFIYLFVCMCKLHGVFLLRLDTRYLTLCPTFKVQIALVRKHRLTWFSRFCLHISTYITAGKWGILPPHTKRCDGTCGNVEKPQT